MLSARRKSDGKTVLAYFERPTNAPFLCLECDEEVILKSGARRISHFAHAKRIICRLANESEEHRRCKMEIYEALQREPGVENIALERSLGAVRPDVSATIRGIPVVIEVQMSALSLESIINRTIWYFRKGIAVLWLLQWTPKLDAGRYTPKLWEKWVHAAYFGRVYYWQSGLNVVSYHFEPSLKSIPKTSWYSKSGKRMTGGGYTRRSMRYRRLVRGRMLNLAKHFVALDRFWWQSGRLKLPDAKLFMEEMDASRSRKERLPPPDWQ